MHLWFFFFATNPVELAFLGFVIESLIRIRHVIMAGADVPQARDYRSPGGQQLVAAQKANAASGSCRTPRRLKLAT